MLNKLQVYNSHFQGIHKLGKKLNRKEASFQKVFFVPFGQLTEISGSICQVTIDTMDVINLLPRPAKSNGLKHKLEYRCNILFKSFRPVLV